MEISSFPQWQIFVYCLLWGLAAGLLYDVFRFLRKAGLNSLLEVVVEDIIFMCLCAVWLFLISSALNLGVVRAYMSAAFFSGAVIYRLTVGVFTGRCFDSIILFFTKVFGVLKRIIKRTFLFFCKQTGKITVIFYFLQRGYKEKSKNHLQLKGSKVYNYKEHSLIAKFRRRKNKCERSSTGS